MSDAPYVFPCGHTVMVPHGGSAKCPECAPLSEYLALQVARSEAAEAFKRSSITDDNPPPPESSRSKRDEVEDAEVARVAAARAEGWEAREKARPQYLGPDDGHYHDCMGWEDCHCASYPNPYVENDPALERACQVMHDAYEEAAGPAGWATQESSRVPWADVPEANKVTMRAAMCALLDHMGGPIPPPATKREAGR